MQLQDYKKYLAIDFGKKRIGLAVGGIYPNGNGIVDAEQGRSFVLETIAKMCKDEHVFGVVVGLPTRSNGDPGTLDKEIREFAHDLSHKTKLPVYFEDENFSSAEAERLLLIHNKALNRKGGYVDEMSAIIILEQFLKRKDESKNIKPDIG